MPRRCLSEGAVDQSLVLATVLEDQTHSALRDIAQVARGRAWRSCKDGADSLEISNMSFQ